MLGIFPYGKVEWNLYYEELVVKTIEDYFLQIKKEGYKIDFQLDFKLVRPGTWYGLDDKPIPLASNGTVVAIGELNSVGNRKFIKLGNDVATYLRDNLSPIFGLENREWGGK